MVQPLGRTWRSELQSTSGYDLGGLGGKGDEVAGKPPSAAGPALPGPHSKKARRTRGGPGDEDGRPYCGINE